MNRFQYLAKSSAAKLAGCVLMLASLSSVAKADPWDRKTYISFSAPVEIPGQVLAPGKYTFRLVDSPSNRNIVQISNERQNHVYATIIAIPTYRMTPPNDTVITFYESRAGDPPPIRAWYYPGDTRGHEFVYPKSRGTLLSTLPPTEDKTIVAQTNTTTTVASAQTTEVTETEAEMTPPPPTPAPVYDTEAVNETEGAVAMTDESHMASEIAAEPQEPTPPPPTPDTSADTKMPETASQLALYGLFGVGAFAAAYGMRARSKRIN